MNIQFLINPHVFIYHLAFQQLRNRDVVALCFPFPRTWHFPLGTFCSFNCDGYQYETKPVTQGGRGYAELLFFPTAEGYVKALYKDDLNEQEPADFQYVYIYKDHLGNNRLSYTLVSGQVYYAVKVEVIFVENKAQNFQHSRVMVKIFNAVIGKKNDAWYGNNTFDLTLNPQTEQVKILEENHYYPFGLKHGSYNNIKKEVKYKEELAEKKEVKQVVADEVAFKYKYNGKELQDELGLNWYDYGARNYQADLGRWFNVDPLAEKYYSHSPYNFVLGNPVRYIDPDGRGVDDIIVPKKYQQQFNKALSSVFGDEAGNFSFDAKGKLSFSGNKKNFNSDQKALFKGLKKLMKSNDVTNVIYEKKYNIVDNNGKSIPIVPSDTGGEGTVLKAENSNVSENYVIIDPKGPSSIKVQEVTNNYYSSKGTVPSLNDPPNFRPAIIQTNSEIATFHGLGHVIYATKPQNKVLNYENKARSQMNMAKRNPDETHNKTVTKGKGAVWEKN